MGKADLLIEGRALLGEELLDRYVEITIRDGRIHRILEIPPRPLPWICPALFNAHTHIGDSVAMDISLPGSLEEAVTPPNGLKHRILGKTRPDDLVRAMRASIGSMAVSGTAGFADFREGGIEGVQAQDEGGPVKIRVRRILFKAGNQYSVNIPDLEFRGIKVFQNQKNKD